MILSLAQIKNPIRNCSARLGLGAPTNGKDALGNILEDAAAAGGVWPSLINDPGVMISPPE